MGRRTTILKLIGAVSLALVILIALLISIPIRGTATPAMATHGNGTDIDIHPGSDPNSINLNSKGVTTVAVIGSESLDASSIDGSTVSFAGADAVQYSLEDVNNDGVLDLVCHFNTQDLELNSDSTTASLTGSTYSGDAFAGTDAVNIVGK